MYIILINSTQISSLTHHTKLESVIIFMPSSCPTWSDTILGSDL